MVLAKRQICIKSFSFHHAFCCSVRDDRKILVFATIDASYRNVNCDTTAVSSAASYLHKYDSQSLCLACEYLVFLIYTSNLTRNK